MPRDPRGHATTTHSSNARATHYFAHDDHVLAANEHVAGRLVAELVFAVPPLYRGIDEHV
jgi:hypothetical protein